jgi:hypothetical protein
VRKKNKGIIFWIFIILLVLGFLYFLVINNSNTITCTNTQTKCGETCMDYCSDGSPGNCEIVGGVYTFTCPPNF